MGKRTHERTIIDWVVYFDNKATHHCKSYDEAVLFARKMRGVGTYGNPREIAKHTRHVTSTYETVWEEGK